MEIRKAGIGEGLGLSTRTWRRVWHTLYEGFKLKYMDILDLLMDIFDFSQEISLFGASGFVGGNFHWPLRNDVFESSRFSLACEQALIFGLSAKSGALWSSPILKSDEAGRLSRTTPFIDRRNLHNPKALAKPLVLNRSGRRPAAF